MADTFTTNETTQEQPNTELTNVSESLLLFQEGMHYLKNGEWNGLQEARGMFKKAYKAARDADDLIEEDLERSLEMLNKISKKALSWRPNRVNDDLKLEEYKEDEARKAANFLELYELG